jgi:hypothetical protein
MDDHDAVMDMLITENGVCRKERKTCISARAGGCEREGSHQPDSGGAKPGADGYIEATYQLLG